GVCSLVWGWWPRACPEPVEGFAPWFWALTWDQEYPLGAALGLPLPVPRRPLRLDFHNSFFSQRIMTETAPLPVCRFQDQPPLHWIAMNITQLLAKLALLAVIVALLPKCASPQAFG